MIEQLQCLNNEISKQISWWNYKKLKWKNVRIQRYQNGEPLQWYSVESNSMVIWENFKKCNMDFYLTLYKPLIHKLLLYFLYPLIGSEKGITSILTYPIICLFLFSNLIFYIYHNLFFLFIFVFTFVFVFLLFFFVSISVFGFCFGFKFGQAFYFGLIFAFNFWFVFVFYPSFYLSLYFSWTNP